MLGTLTSIGLPLLASWMGDGAEGARGLRRRIGRSQEQPGGDERTGGDLHDRRPAGAEGEIRRGRRLELAQFIDLQTQIAQMDALAATRETLAKLKEDLAGSFWGTGDIVYELQQQFGVTLLGKRTSFTLPYEFSQHRLLNQHVATFP